MPFSARSSSGSGSGASHFSRTSSRDSRALSAWSIRILLQLGLGDLVGAGKHRCRGRRTRWISWLAVLGPMPGTPGTLSTLSPISARTSPTSSGADAELLVDIGSRRCGGRSSCRACRPIRPRSAASDPCRRLTMVTFQPAAWPRLDVAGDDVVGLEPLIPRCTGSRRRASRCGSAGIAGRGLRAAAGGCALYWSYMSLRNVCSDLSRMTAIWVGPSALLRPSASFHSIVV